MSKTIISRNNSIAFKNLTDAHGSLNEQFKASAKEHNETYVSILNHIGDKSTTNKRIKAVKEKVAKENSFHVYGYESDCDDDNEGADSQEDQIKHLLRCWVRMNDDEWCKREAWECCVKAWCQDCVNLLHNVNVLWRLDQYNIILHCVEFIYHNNFAIYVDSIKIYHSFAIT